MIGVVRWPGAPRLERAGPSLPALVNTVIPHLRTASSKVADTRPRLALQKGSPYERLIRSQRALRGDQRAHEAGARLRRAEPAVANLRQDLRAGRHAVPLGRLLEVRAHDARHVRPVAARVDDNLQQVATL